MTKANNPSSQKNKARAPLSPCAQWAGVQKELVIDGLTERHDSEPIPCDFLSQKASQGCDREWTQSIEPSFESAQESLRMGIELETFLLDATNLVPLGAPGANPELSGGKFLEAIAADFGAAARIIRDGDVVYGLFLDEGLAYSLEPGGQLEVATPPRDTVAEVAADLRRSFALVEGVARGQVRFLSHGTNPLTSPSFGLQVPKKRYRMLTRYLKSESGGRGIDMMRHATTVQPNIDIGPLAADWQEATRLTYCLSPYFKNLFPNSFFFQNQFFADGLERQRIWSSMDASRTGIPEGILAAKDPSCTYACWASKAFVFLIDSLPEDQQPLFGELRFCDWFANGYKGTKPSLADWERHLATLFPELRLRGFLELRMFDSQPYERIVPLLAFVRGLLQSRQGRTQARAALEQMNHSDSSTVQFELLREAALVGLGELGEPDALEALSRLEPVNLRTFGAIANAREFVERFHVQKPSELF